MKKIFLILSVLLLLSIPVFAITSDEAERIAFNDASVSSSSIDHIKTSFERDRNLSFYEVEFYYDGVEYEYKIDSESGEILKKEREAKRTRSMAITRDDALSIVLDHASLLESDISRVRVKNDEGKYEVEFNTSLYEWDAEVLSDGTLISFEYELRVKPRSSRNATLIDLSRAEEIILSYLPQSSQLSRIERDYDDRLYIYEARAYNSGIEYEIEISAETGDLIKYKEEMR